MVKLSEMELKTLLQGGEANAQLRSARMPFVSMDGKWRIPKPYSCSGQPEWNSFLADSMFVTYRSFRRPSSTLFALFAEMADMLPTCLHIRHHSATPFTKITL